MILRETFPKWLTYSWVSFCAKRHKTDTVRHLCFTCEPVGYKQMID